MFLRTALTFKKIEDLGYSVCAVEVKLNNILQSQTVKLTIIVSVMTSNVMDYMDAYIEDV